MCYFCHAQLFEITHAENIKSPLVQPSCQNAKVVEAFCDAGCRLSTRCWAPVHAGMHVVSNCRRAYHRERRGRAISIVIVAGQCRTSRDFVPWRFLDAGHLSAWTGRHCRRPKTCTITDIHGQLLLTPAAPLFAVLLRIWRGLPGGETGTCA